LKPFIAPTDRYATFHPFDFKWEYLENQSCVWQTSPAKMELTRIWN